MTRLLSVICALLFVLVSAPTCVFAQNIKGQNDEAFSLATEQWLAGDDLEALQSLRELSHDGNRAAQILLASIASQTNTHGHITKQLSRKDRIDLLRIPKGLSGKSWLTAAQKDEPLAAALLQAKLVKEKNAAVVALILMGEIYQGLISVEFIKSQSDADAIVEAISASKSKFIDNIHLAVLWEFYSNEWGLPRDQRHIRIAVHRNGIQFDAAQLEIAQMAYRIVDLRELRKSADLQKQVLQISDKVESWLPVRKFCEKNCAEAVSECTIMGSQLLHVSGGFPIHSPLESLISTSRYWASERIEGDLVRQVADLTDNYSWAFPTTFGTCFYDAIELVQSEHGVAKN